MPCSSLDIFALAKHLHETGIGEANSRSVVSRAYYAALHEVAATFEERAVEFKVDGESSHREIIARASVYGSSLQPGRTSAASIAKTMTRLRRTRNEADYRLGNEFAHDLDKDCLARAQSIFTLCADVMARRLAS